MPKYTSATIFQVRAVKARGDVGEPVSAYIIQWQPTAKFDDSSASTVSGQVELAASGLTNLAPPSLSGATPKYAYTITGLYRVNTAGAERRDRVKDWGMGVPPFLNCLRQNLLKRRLMSLWKV